MRIEPPPSLAAATGRIPAATAAAAPPEDPPGVRAEIPRIARRSVQLRLAHRLGAELGRARLAEHDQAGGQPPLDDGGVPLGGPPGQRAAASGRRLPGVLLVEILEQERHSGEWSARAPPPRCASARASIRRTMALIRGFTASARARAASSSSAALTCAPADQLAQRQPVVSRVLVSVHRGIVTDGGRRIRRSAQPGAAPERHPRQLDAPMLVYVSKAVGKRQACVDIGRT